MSWDVFDTLGRYLRPATEAEVRRALPVPSSDQRVFSDGPRVRYIRPAV